MDGKREYKLRRRWDLLAASGFMIISTVWLGSNSAGIGQPAGWAVPGRVEGGSGVLSLGTAATGIIAELLVAPGSHVHEGQLLVRIECDYIERELESRKSDLVAAEAALLRTVHGPRAEEITIGLANVNLAEARLQEAEKSFARTQQLHEGFTVTRVQIDQAQRDARIAGALLQEVQAKLALLKAGSREEDLTEARARRDAAKGRVEETASRLSYCSVRAPIEGLVLDTHVSPGQLVSFTIPTTLLTMVDDSQRRVRTYVDERDVSKLCSSQHARISADGIPGLQVDGTVGTIGVVDGDSPFVNNGSGQFRQVMLAAADNQLRMPIGLRVMVQFLPCPAAQKSIAK